ncbi:DEAD/DEAH box helicase [Vibrio sp. 99-8-1]|uniref:DUF3427 domain-containing protein n=1 Tax=Vibrio sp. 99-8-1 TaxID=2607602 RepID=UPI0014937F81|nr:DEAD/DEAH box helicase [Vibrio sp. 99-8-1]NOI66430.1 DEAD/DEAH box helicase [Vibrio sp. 99-8-1]
MNCVTPPVAGHSENHLVLNNSHDNFFNELRSSFYSCKFFYINVAFISYSGLQILLDILKEARGKGIKGKVITSTYLNFTDPKALEKLRSFDNIELKLFIAKPNLGFHPKGYIFEYENETKVIIGSANITQSALKSNVEWNVATKAETDNKFVSTVLDEFNNVWKCAVELTDTVLEEYRIFLRDKVKSKRKASQFVLGESKVEPNVMQSEALDNLNRLRSHGENKALAIAATGSGKTYMAAFDVRKADPKRVLFVVHREEILLDARKSFIHVMGKEPSDFGILSANQKDWNSDYLFATNMSIAKNLTRFDPSHFEYIVIDEAHHVSSDTYQEILDYFEPKFLLGMTATPERGDAQSIYENFDNNIAVEIRLRDALDADLVVPFHYFGITEAESIDYEGIDLNDISAVAKLLKTNRRVDHIISNMEFYGYDGDTCRAVGFCVSIEHAQYMAEEFNKAGIAACCLSSENSRQERQNAIAQLSDAEDPLKIIFTVDLFNEGIDIPSINLVLMLRPTSSPVVFIQQLGRGLRKHEDKSFLTVLDFIGNHNKAFLMAIALCGSRVYDKDSLKVAVKNDFSSIPGCTHIQLDRISKEQILQQIEIENFNSMKYLKEEYLNFKLDLGNRIPLLMDFNIVDGAPDPIRYIKKHRSYLNFLSKVEKNEPTLMPLLANDLHDKYQRYLDGCLPIKRPHEFVLINYLMDHDFISFSQAVNEIEKYVQSVDIETLRHAFEHINGDFFDSREKKSWPKIAKLVEKDEQLILVRSGELSEILNKPSSKNWLLQSIEYGLENYAENFGSDVFGLPSLKLYQQYNMRDIALMANVRKVHSSYRGTGVLREGKDFFFFIDLHKEEGAIDYKDKFVSSTQFQWDSPSGCSPTSQQGRDIIQHLEKDIKLHLFVRKFKELDGVTEPYVYIGKGDVISYEGEKPINFQLALQTEVPQRIYDEFVTDTTVE